MTGRHTNRRHCPRQIDSQITLSRYRGRQPIRNPPEYATYHNDRERLRAFNVEQEGRYKASGMDEHQTDPMSSGQRRDCFVQKFLHAVGCTSLVCS